MKNIPLFFALIFATNLSAQSSLGLIAHWNMNGGTTDVSGNGHTGHPTNVTATTGMTGLPNTAYYFNGVNSIITAPYMPDLNLTNYSICAVVNVKGFYSGLCQANTIISRGKPNGPGGYSLYFDDNAFDGSSCTAIDSTKDGFKVSAGTGAAPGYTWQYLPAIVKDKWYRVIGTWNGTHWKIYVDDTLRVTVLQTGGAIGSSSDSISIGRNLYETVAGYPYHFKGIIDDIRIYNRVLADTEIVQYGDTCGTITLQPANTSATVGSTRKFFIATSISTPTYQWQQDAGIGYTDLTNSGPFSGVNTDTLRISGVVATMNGNNYRCEVTNAVSCMEMSVSGLLAVTTGVNEFISPDLVGVYPNPTDDKIVIQLPYTPLTGVVQVINELGQVVSEQVINGASTTLSLNQLPSRVYVLRIECDGQVIYKKALKN